VALAHSIPLPTAGARAKIPAALLRRLTLQVGQHLEAVVPKRWLWQGQHVFLADGTTTSLADTPENQQAYPQPPAQKPGLGFPLMRMVVLLSLATAGLQGLAFGRYEGKETGETALFRTMLEQIPQGSIILADRYYCSYFLIALLQQGGGRSGLPHPSATQVRLCPGPTLGTGRSRGELAQAAATGVAGSGRVYTALPATLTVREMRIQVRRPGYRVRELVVATTLCDATRYSKEEVMDLYQERWHVELDIRAHQTVAGNGAFALLDSIHGGEGTVDVLARLQFGAEDIRSGSVRTGAASATNQFHGNQASDCGIVGSR